ncbi:MAG: hypothetical protein J6J36_00675 [Clostridia bacterium]|nr:hypothetical protein [Clostridia bacterium]
MKAYVIGSKLNKVNYLKRTLNEIGKELILFEEGLPGAQTFATKEDAERYLKFFKATALLTKQAVKNSKIREIEII